MLLTQRPNLYIIEDDKKGRGIYCSDDIAKGEIIECCPVIIFSKKDTALIHQTELFNYYFIWDEPAETSAIPLGYGCLYNHSGKPNAETEVDYDRHEIKFVAISDINAGSEILINYWGVEGQSFKKGLEREKKKSIL